jgi:hypothetical protein
VILTGDFRVILTGDFRVILTGDFRVILTGDFRVILTGDFNVPNYNWSYGTPLPNAHYYSKIKGNLFHATACFLGLNQHDTVSNGSLLDLVFTNSVA